MRPDYKDRLTVIVAVFVTALMLSLIGGMISSIAGDDGSFLPALFFGLMFQVTSAGLLVYVIILGIKLMRKVIKDDGRGTARD